MPAMPAMPTLAHCALDTTRPDCQYGDYRPAERQNRLGWTGPGSAGRSGVNSLEGRTSCTKGGRTTSGPGFRFFPLQFLPLSLPKLVLNTIYQESNFWVKILSSD